MTTFTMISVCAYSATLLTGLLRRERFFLFFAGIILGIHTLSSTALYPAIAKYGQPAEVLFWLGQAATFVYFARFARARTPPLLYRVTVSWPASMFAAATFLAIPWAVAEGLGFSSFVPWLPFAIAAFGLLQSLVTRSEHRLIVLDGKDKGELQRAPENVRRVLRKHPHVQGRRPLRIVQISDPHLGPFMSVARLSKICQRAIDDEPDLILLTGDFLTVESQHSPEPLTRALAPLRALRGRVFACMGNHDHECPELVDQALADNGVCLLIDEAVEVDTPWGRVQVVGADHRWTRRAEALSRLCASYPRKEGVLRLWMLHDPGAFRDIPEGEADLVLSGHTHGGHLGLLSLGFSQTIVSAATSMPDHGLWARGRDRLYVHRGTGHYGFPLRIGVPAEESLLEVVTEQASQSAT